MWKADKHGLPRILRAARFSMQGMMAAWRHEHAFREESLAVAVLIPTAFWLGQSALEIGFLIFMALQVLIVELINSAIEAVVDRISVEHHPLAGRAKDLGSAAVFVSIAALIVAWALVAWERFA